MRVLWLIHIENSIIIMPNVATFIFTTDWLCLEHNIAGPGPAAYHRADKYTPTSAVSQLFFTIA